MLQLQGFLDSSGFGGRPGKIPLQKPFSTVSYCAKRTKNFVQNWNFTSQVSAHLIAFTGIC